MSEKIPETMSDEVRTAVTDELDHLAGTLEACFSQQYGFTLGDAIRLIRNRRADLLDGRG
jgi:hypothetical protein